MHCVRISVAGEEEEIVVSPRPRSRQKHEKRPNPYSAIGLDKFESVCAELCAKREYIAKKPGASAALVRFVDSKTGWIPVVVRAREGIGKKNSGANAAGASILGPVEKSNGEEDREFSTKVEGNGINGRPESISISVLDERNHRLVIPWSRFLKTAAMGVLVILNAIWVRKSVTALTVITAVGISYLAALFRNPRNPNARQAEGSRVEAISEQKDVDKLSRRSSPRPGLTVKPKHGNEQHKHNHQLKSQAKRVRLLVPIDNRPDIKPARPTQGFDSLYRRSGPTMAYDARAGATVTIITLFCLVFYGPLCAMLLWLYLLSLW